MPATFAAPVQGDVRIRFGDAGNALAGLHRGVERGARCAAAGLVILAYARVEQCVGEFQLPTLGKLGRQPRLRSEEHTSELQSLMRTSYAVFCLKKKITRSKT